MNETFYVRNWHPNAVRFRYAGLEFNLERRGSRRDVLALPIEAKKDPTVNRWLNKGVLEEIDQEDFIALSAREEDAEYPKLISSINTVDIPLDMRHKPILGVTPYTIDMDKLNSNEFKQEHMSPRLEYMNPPLTTKEELAKVQVAEQAAKPTRTPRAKKK